ncbi:MAG: hypothetical protein Q9157_007531 [Trypethelium eluteriae]
MSTDLPCLGSLSQEYYANMCLPFPPPQSVHAQPAQFVRRKPKKEEKKPKKDGSKESLSEDGTPCYHTHGQVTCSTCKAFLGLAVAADGSGATYPLPAVEVPKKKEKPKDRKKNKEDNHKQEHNAGRRLQTVPVYYTMVNPPSEESSSASDTHDCSRTDHLHIHIPQQQKPETPETASKKSSHHSSRPKQDDEQDQHYDTYGRTIVASFVAIDIGLESSRNVGARDCKGISGEGERE